MVQKSTITKLDPRIRAEVDRLIREDGYTIDGLLEAIKALGGEASRSAVGRYAQNAEAQMERYRQAQEVAKVWIGKLTADPQGDVSRLLIEMCRTLAFQQIDKLSDSNTTGAMDVMLISKALKDLAGTDKLTVERIEKIKDIARVEAMREAAERASQFATTEGLSAEQAVKLRKSILSQVA